MFLQKLEIQGFKSFAHKTVLQFPRRTSAERGITAIVGPNGSGKSNVADAIRWVLGEQSMRLLRSKKSEDVIFFGSDTKAQLGFCEVSLHFNNEDHAIPLDYVEVVIARRLYRSGDSEYLVNGSKVRLADIILLLAQSHFGQRSYSVIGQGMIDSLVTMSPSERKSFFDEAVGVRQYQIKKEQSAQKLKAARENIAQANMLIAELEPKIRFFQRQAKRLEERGALEAELKKTLYTYYGIAWNDINKKHTDCENALQESQRELDDAIARHDAVMEKLTTFRQGAFETANAKNTVIRQEYEGLVVKRSAAQGRLALVDARIAAGLESRGEANVSFALQRKNELESQEKTALEEYEWFSTDQVRLASLEQSFAIELEKIEQSITEAEMLFVGKTLQPEGLSTEDIRASLNALCEEKEFFFAAERTEYELRDGIARIFNRLDEIIQHIGQADAAARTDDGHKNALERLYQEKRDALSRLQEVRIQQGIAEHSLGRLAAARTTLSSEREKVERELAYFSSNDTNKKKKQLTDERLFCVQESERYDVRIAALKEEIDASYAAQTALAAETLRAQQELTTAQQSIDTIRSRHTSLSLEQARCEAHQEELYGKMCEELGLTDEQQTLPHHRRYDPVLFGIRMPETVGGNPSDIRKTIDAAKRKLDAIGSIDQEALAEYESTKERYEFLVSQSTDLTASIESLEYGIEELEAAMKERFQSSLSDIEKKFDHYFQRLFNGGRAHVTLLKSADVAADIPSDEIEHSGEKKPEQQSNDIVGIEISAMPPGKKLKSMNVLSGGEKALTAIALICAIVSHNPSPFVVLDEVDAALDESNANRFASIIQELGAQTQFIVITHNRATIHTAHCIYGVTMDDSGTSRILSLDIGEIDDTLNRIAHPAPSVVHS